MFEKFFGSGNGPKKKPADHDSKPAHVAQGPSELSHLSLSSADDRVAYIVSQMGRGVELNSSLAMVSKEFPVILQFREASGGAERAFGFVSQEQAGRAHSMLARLYPEGAARFIS